MVDVEALAEAEEVDVVVAEAVVQEAIVEDIKWADMTKEDTETNGVVATAGAIKDKTKVGAMMEAMEVVKAEAGAIILAAEMEAGTTVMVRVATIITDLNKEDKVEVMEATEAVLEVQEDQWEVAWEVDTIKAIPEAP